VPETLLDAVSAVAAEVGAMALASWRGDFRHWNKDEGSPVSDIDLAADALLYERLMAIDPEAGWLSEETADNASRLNCVRVWVVDPIDGTRDYVRGRDGWAVSIALVEGGRPLIGVLDAPARGEHWRAQSGQGATRNGVPLIASRRTDLFGARVPADVLMKQDADLVTVPKPNSIALRIAMVAAGEADLLATIRWGHEWDIAAAALIAQEAGATVTNAFGHPLRYNSTRGEAFGVLATAPGIHACAVERLASRAVKGVVR
jgi:myo-inositol-1(or 4)-monophosphatase